MENDKIEQLLVQILENQTSIKSGISNLTSKVDKDSIILKKIQNDVKTLFKTKLSF